MKLLVHRVCAHVDVKGRLEYRIYSVSSALMTFTQLVTRPVTLSNLPLHGRVAVVPKHFQFAITRLTVDDGRSRKQLAYSDSGINDSTGQKFIELFTATHPFHVCKGTLRDVFIYLFN